jgi:hypothetical protein
MLGLIAHTAEKPERPTRSGGKRRTSSRKIPPIVGIARRLGRLIPDEELRLIPKDLSDQIDHYVYGAPKR